MSCRPGCVLFAPRSSVSLSLARVRPRHGWYIVSRGAASPQCACWRLHDAVHSAFRILSRAHVQGVCREPRPPYDGRDPQAVLRPLWRGGRRNHSRAGRGRSAARIRDRAVPRSAARAAGNRDAHRQAHQWARGPDQRGREEGQAHAARREGAAHFAARSASIPAPRPGWSTSGAFASGQQQANGLRLAPGCRSSRVRWSIRRWCQPLQPQSASRARCTGRRSVGSRRFRCGRAGLRSVFAERTPSAWISNDWRRSRCFASVEPSAWWRESGAPRISSPTDGWRCNCWRTNQPSARSSFLSSARGEWCKQPASCGGTACAADRNSGCTAARATCWHDAPGGRCSGCRCTASAPARGEEEASDRFVNRRPCAVGGRGKAVSTRRDAQDSTRLQGRAGR